MTILEGGQHRYIGPYQILEELGQGGMAVVYLAYDRGLDRRVALKLILPAKVDDLEFTRRFMFEARVAARLIHPHIVRIYGVDQSDRPVYFVMEYLSGGTLRTLMRAEGAMSVERTIGLLRQIADGLDFAHGEGVVHRDVKPSNILLDGNQEAHLGDFGIARAWDSVDMTVTGKAMGTVEYMAPEQALGLKDVDARADLYAFGVIAFEMLAGRVPFAGPGTAVIHAHVYASPPSLRELRQTLPLHVEAAVLRMLAKSPDDRFQSATAFVDALQGSEKPTVVDAARGRDIRPLPPAPPVPPAPPAPTRSKAPVLLALAALGVVLLGALILALHPWPSSPLPPVAEPLPSTVSTTTTAPTATTLVAIVPTTVPTVAAVVPTTVPTVAAVVPTTVRTLAPTLTASAAAADKIVVDFYSDNSNGNYTAAWSLLCTSAQCPGTGRGQAYYGTLQQFEAVKLQGTAKITGTTVDQNGTARVGFNLTTPTVGTRGGQECFQGTWTLVMVNGAWKLDSPSIIKMNTCPP